MAAFISLMQFSAGGARKALISKEISSSLYPQDEHFFVEGNPIMQNVKSSKQEKYYKLKLP